MPDRDYYESLGISRSASPDEIKKAYRAQARKYHPDVNPGDKAAEVKFKEIQNAYDVLSEPEKRKLYDQFGHAAFQGGGPGPRAGAGEWAAKQGGFGPGYENIDFSAFFGNPGRSSGTTGNPGDHEEGVGSIFEELLGRVRGDKSGKKRGGRASNRAPEFHLTIPFLTAVKGGETSIEVPRSYGGSESLVVKIPPGLESGKKLRLRGQGEPGPSGERTDLTIVVAVDGHPYFSREGRNLTVEVPISISEALLGAKVDVPTLDGLKTLPVPAGSSSGTKLRLRGQGVPSFRDEPAGDLFVVIKVVVPKNLDDESRRWIEQFAARNPQNPRAGLWVG
ncbi:MAG: J domain-containing protein [Isosphaeraceae bacterium]|nr:J domain-containing protein [Isosphaeraceae bacterium]